MSMMHTFVNSRNNRCHFLVLAEKKGYAQPQVGSGINRGAIIISIYERNWSMVGDYFSFVNYEGYEQRERIANSLAQ